MAAASSVADLLPSESDVHEALEVMGDGVRLGQARLASCFPQLAAIEPLNERARRLRSLLLEAIEALGPPRPVPFGSLESRAYDVLTLRYIERMSVVAMAEELSLSRRQVHRDLKQAERRLGELLASWAGHHQDRPVDGQVGDSLSEELALFPRRPVEVRLSTALNDALALVRPLADSLGVAIAFPKFGEDLPKVVADRAFLSQLLVQILSLAVQSADPKQIFVGVEVAGENAELRVCFRALAAANLSSRVESIRRMAQSEAIQCLTEAGQAGEVKLTLVAKCGTPLSVLVVEDNPGAIELYRRYLTSSSWQVHGLSDPRLCYDLVRTNQPHLVVLDVMMPHVDGWTVLRALKGHPETARVPVIVCSVVEDPALATALGAAVYLRKPVSQAEFLMAVDRCLEVSARHWLS
ncbi:MAG: response regulator [Anaerolineae bacterium]